MTFDFDFLADTLRQLLAAVPTTLGLFFASLVLGGLLSLVIVAMRVSPHWLPNRFGRAYILVFRGSPLLIQMFLVYYGLGQFGVIRESFLGRCCASPTHARCCRSRCARPAIRSGCRASRCCAA